MHNQTQITYKQQMMIDMIEENLGVKFYGNTRKEASQFIGGYMEAFQREAMEDECNSYGLPNQ